MRVLIVGTLEGHISAAGKIAIERGAKVHHVDTIDSALMYLRSGRGSDMVLVDVRLEISHLIQSMKMERIATPVVACGIGVSAKTAVSAIKAGAKEYIPLPPNAELIAAVLAAVSQQEGEVVSQDPTMLATLKLVDQIAPSDASILITGESGTGKEVIANLIHRKSKRRNGTFVSVNCAAIPEALLESELFGHEKGAFTGAVARRIGKFEEASGGTLLLDEISEMDPRLQAKLLRAIQEREIDRIGGSRPIKVDIRLLATSNRDLQEEVKKGTFREDLYFRLNVMNLHIPALRNRKEDLIPLAEHFIRKYSASNGIASKTLAKESTQILLEYAWPGNVRELENTMHRAILLAEQETIDPSAILLGSQQYESRPPVFPMSQISETRTEGQKLSSATHQAGSASNMKTLEQDENALLVGRKLSDVEQTLIIGTLEHCLGNRTHAANILGISIRTLRNKLKQYVEDGVSIPAPH